MRRYGPRVVAGLVMLLLVAAVDTPDRAGLWAAVLGWALAGYVVGRSARKKT